MRKILNSLNRAVKEYNLITKGDSVAVGVSGGKDSLILLSALSEYRKYKDSDFNLIAITVDQTNGKTDFSEITKFCKEINVPYYVEKTNIFEVVFDIRKEKNPCSLCANMRRGVLNSKAKELGCNKIALAHHKDDLIETFFLSLFYEGRISTFLPSTYLSETNITCIRPLIHVSEHDIREKSKKYNLPILENTCPVNHKTRREDIKNLIAELEKKFPNSKDLIHRAITHPERMILPPPVKK